jgi:hypothetical protein
VGKDGPEQSFAEYLKDAPVAPDTAPKLIVTGEVKRSTEEGKFVFRSPETGTVELPVDAVIAFEPKDDGLTAITLDLAGARGRSATTPRRAGGRGLVPFVMATPHRAAAAAVRAQFQDAETTEAILDVETAFIKDVWIDQSTDPIKDVFDEIAVQASPFRF